MLLKSVIEKLNKLYIHVLCNIAHAESLPHEERKAYAEKVIKHSLYLYDVHLIGSNVLLEGNRWR